MNRSVLSAVVIVVGLSAWMMSGSDSQATDAQQVPEPEKKNLMKVQVVHSQAQPVQRLTSIQGQVEARRIVNVKAEVDGQVEHLPVAEGQRVTEDALLVKLAEDYRPAQLAEAEARLKQRLSDLKASQKLRKRGLQAENRLVADQAEVQAARAQLAQARYQLNHTRISAPFAGVLNSRSVELGDFVEKGQVIAELVDDEQLIVTGQVPQNRIAGVELGQQVDVRLANGETLSGELTFLSSTADNATRSYRAEVSIDNPTHKRLIGLSATIQLPQGNYQGHWVSSSVLGLSTAGELQVKLLTAGNTVEAKTVEIIRTDEDGFWVDGLSDNVTVISLGQNFVTTGDHVEPVEVVAGSPK